MALPTISKGAPKKRRLRLPPKANDLTDPVSNLCSSLARLNITTEHVAQPDSALLSLPVEVRRSILEYAFSGVRITLANARWLDERSSPPDHQYTDHRQNVLRLTAVCRQLKVESWQALKCHRFGAYRLYDVVGAADAAPLLEKIESLFINIDGCWAFADFFAQHRFPNLKVLSTKLKWAADPYDSRLPSKKLEDEYIIYQILGAFRSSGGMSLRAFFSTDNAQWTTYRRTLDVFVRIEFLGRGSQRRSKEFSGTIINGRLSIMEVAFGTAEAWKMGLEAALDTEDW